MGVFNKTIIPSALVGYEIVIANLALRALVEYLLNIQRESAAFKTLTYRAQYVINPANLKLDPIKELPVFVTASNSQSLENKASSKN